MAKLTKNQMKKKIKRAKKEFWECLRRNENYKKRCAGYKKLTNRRQKFAEGLRIADKYGILPYDTNLEFNDEIESNIQFGWIKFPKNSLRFPLSEASLMVWNNFEAATEPQLRFSSRSEALEEGRYLNVSLDVSLPIELNLVMLEDILSSVKKKLLKDVKWGAERNREADFDFSMKVWDLSLQGLSQTQIAKKLLPRMSDIDNARDRIRRSQQKARFLIDSIE